MKVELIKREKPEETKAVEGSWSTKQQEQVTPLQQGRSLRLIRGEVLQDSETERHPYAHDP